MGGEASFTSHGRDHVGNGYGQCVALGLPSASLKANPQDGLAPGRSCRRGRRLVGMGPARLARSASDRACRWSQAGLPDNAILQLHAVCDFPCTCVNVSLAPINVTAG